MSFDSPPIPPEGKPKQDNRLLWGCLIALLVSTVVCCCAGSLLFLPLFTDFDPLGTNLRERLEQYLPLEYLEDPSLIPGLEDFPADGGGGSIPTQSLDPASQDRANARSIPLALFSFNDIGTAFSYPSGWDIELDVYTATFYHPDSYTYLYMGEELVDPGTTAQEVADVVMASIGEDAQQGSLTQLSGIPYQVPIAGDAYLTLFEWIDQDGYYTWAYDLEIVSGDSNIFFFLSGEEADEIGLYGELLDIIAASLWEVELPENGTDT